MKNLINSLYNFITSLGTIDVIFIAAVLILIILIVVMIYIMRMEEEVIFQYQDEVDDNKSITPVAPVVNDSNIIDNNTGNSVDLLSISKEIENTPTKKIELTPYEEEQEERAIISYDELISNTGKIKLKYAEEEKIDEDLVVKKVNMEDLNVPEVEMPKLASVINEEIKSAPVISYAKEEEFLAALKRMQQILN